MGISGRMEDDLYLALIVLQFILLCYALSFCDLFEVLEDFFVDEIREFKQAHHLRKWD